MLHFIKFLTGKKSYVLRTITYQGKKDRIKQVYAQKIASDYGYGPHLCAYDIDQGKILMSFLKNHQEDMDLSIKAFKMAELLKKIHHGPALYNHELMVDRIKKMFPHVTTYPKDIDKEKILSIINKLEATKTTHLSPIHGDLNRSNIIFVDGEYKVIDFDNAGQDDPFFDLATVIIYNFDNTPYETEFLHYYFGHLPSKSEMIHLNEMKQAVGLYLGLNILLQIPPQIILQAGDPISLSQYFEARKQGKLQMNENTRLIFAQSMLKMAIDLE